MNDHEKSHRPVVPVKSRNKAEEAATDGMEGRGLTKENPSQQNTLRTQSRERVPNALERVREVAKRDSKIRFTALLHHITPTRLEEAYRRLNREAATGVDGVSWEQYGERIEENIRDLHDRLHRGAYRAKPVKRSLIPKADGGQRPLGIVTVEDKIVQAAVAEVLNAIYEEDFLGFCYGFRRGRSQHDALDALATAILSRKVNWVLDADIQGFFDSISHEWMQKFIEYRIGDRRVVRLLMKWLKAGVMEKGQWSRSESGTPQGAVISPLLANIYLFYVFDQWAHHWRKQPGRGEAVIVRYADDFVVGFERREDAEQFRDDLRERLRKFALELHPEKTRILEFGRYAAERRQRRAEQKPETFTFLGFTHICALDHRGRYALKRVTDRKRLRRKLREVNKELKQRRHQPIPEQGQWLQRVIRGFDQYHAVPGNIQALRSFRNAIEGLWFASLKRRSQRYRLLRSRMKRLCTRWLPTPKVLHPWPDARFNAKILGKSRMQ